MGKTINRFTKIVLSVVMMFSVLHLPALDPTSVYATTDETPETTTIDTETTVEEQEEAVVEVENEETVIVDTTEEVAVVDETGDEAVTVEETSEVEEAPVAEEAPAAEETPVAEEAVAEETTVADPVEEEPAVIVEEPAAEQEEVAETPVAEEAPVVEETPAVEEAPVAEEAPAVEEAPIAEETSAVEEAPVVQPTVYTVELDEITVTATVAEGTFNEEVELVVTPIYSNTWAYKEAEETLKDDGAEFDGMLAFDIYFKSVATGEKIEPVDGVSVEMSLNERALNQIGADVDVETVNVTHITDDNKVEKVADVSDETAGTVEVSATEEKVESVDASFDVDSFSTFTITWNHYGNRTVTVHYVDTNGNELTIKNPANTHGNLTAQSSSPAFLIYDIEGYTYSYTYRNTNNNQNRIAPLLTKNNNNYWRYTGTGNVDWHEMSNNDNIYVVYTKDATPTTGGTPSTDIEETWPAGDDAPQFGKSSTNNGNGTNTISLSIEAGEKPVSKATPADVIVIFDVSGSMGGDNIWRLNTAKTAVNNMANTLLNGDNDGVRMALISFSTTAQQVNITGATNGFTSSYANFSSAVNSLTASGGTNWEQALKLANEMSVRSDAATFVVFVTDGDPTFRVSRGDVTNNNLESDTYNSNTTYQYYRNNHVFGQGNNDSSGYNFDYAVDQVEAIAGNNKNFYAIGISNDVTKVRTLTTEGGVAANHAFIASDSAAMEAAFKSITESIKSTLGFGDVQITDGITALTNAEMKVMQSVDPASFKYYRYGGANNKYGNGYANKQEWTTREADGCAAASYNSGDGAVHWDMGEAFQLEDGVTYVVEFVVWPSQAAYDLVADLNNGLKTYASLTAAEKAQVVEVTPPTETTTGTYALKTNTDQVNATYNKTTKSGDTVTISDQTDIKATYHQGKLDNMELDSDYITIKKEWHNALDTRVESGITLTVTKDGAVYLNNVTLNPDNSWTSDEEYISAGFITKTADGRYNVRETGHDYTVTEPASFSYYWDLTADVYRPMVIDGTLNLLIKTDSPTGTEGTDYFVINGSSYQVSSTTHPQLVAQNDRRSNLNLKKLVTANTQAVDNVPDPDDVFTYTITVTDVNGDDVWFGAQDESGATVIIESYSSNVTPEIRNEQPTGSYSVPSGAQFTISIKAGWNVRFFNLPTGTTYSIQETGMVDGYEFVKAETSAEVTAPEYADKYKATPGTVSGNTVTGTIDQPNNVFSTEYTNNWNPNNEIVVIKVDENGAKLAGADFKLSKLAADGWKEIATFTSKADAGETIKVGHGLYKLEETTAPTGYGNTETVYFEVVTSGNTTTVSLTDETGEEKTYLDASASGNEVTIKNLPLATANATKEWKNADDSTTAPANASVVFTLYKDGTATEYTVTLDGTVDTTVPTTAGGYESEAWKAEFVNLEKYKMVDGQRVEIVYTIAETTGYGGYNATPTTPVESGSTITNTQEAVDVSAKKAWKNADGTTTAPANAKVTFTLLADGIETAKTVELDGTVNAPDETPAWTANWKNLPKYQPGTTTEIAYTVIETTSWPGYTANPTTAVTPGQTITNEQGITSASATKAWKNADGSTTAPTGASVVFTLYADGTATDKTVTLNGVVDTNGEETVWVATFNNLPKSKIVDGAAVDIVYTIAETTTYPGYTASTEEPVASGQTITNSQEATTANALKAWKNADGSTTAPQGATVVYTLYAGGEATKYTVTLDGTDETTAPTVTGGYESEAWKAMFVNLPKYAADGTTEIVYTIAETTTYPG
ncbi:MAG: Cna B-type domain-containing protein, partial [Erysipelotrichaceae bacterium]|nr:Cna B-type domain-containing protein [Erysipelotrichaceae bacterium]